MSRHHKYKTWEDTETTKWTQRGLQQYHSETKKTIKKDIWSKEDNKDMKEEFNKDVENLRKKNQTETMEIKVSWNQIKKKIQGKATPGDKKWKTEFEGFKTK
jgi:hypothetical protein